MPVAATSTAHLVHGAAPQERLREMLASLHVTQPVVREPREHHLSEPIVVPLPRRAVLDTPDW